MNPLNRRRPGLRPALLATFVLLAGAGRLSAQDAPAELYAPSERAKKLIVQLTGASGAEGAGIVVNVDERFIYGVTAKHVLMAQGKLVGGLQARLRIWPRPLPASVDRGHNTFDLAAFKIDYRLLGLSAEEVMAALDFRQLGSSQTLDAGAEIYTIGHAAGGAWIDSKEPGHLASRDAAAGRGGEILTLQHFCPRGHSGGGVFDKDWRLVGMIVDNQEPFCNAIRIEKVLSLLADWKYTSLLVPSDQQAAGIAPREIVVAVVDFDNRTGAHLPDIGAAGRDITSSFLFNIPGVKVVTRDRLASVQREMGMHGTQGSVAGATRLGKLLDATAIVTGSINRYDVERRVFAGHGTKAAADLYRMSLTLQIIDIESGEVRFSNTFDIERRSAYAQASSAPAEPLHREAELLEALLENTARDKVVSGLRQIAGGGVAGKLLALPIVSDPPGAEVIIGGVIEGLTPLTVDLRAGIHEIELVKVGFAPWKRRVNVTPDLKLEVHLAPRAVE